jgi:meiotic recombination protein REC8
MISESPLHRHSQPGGLDALQFLEDDEGDLGNLGGDDYGFAGPGISSDMPEAMLAEPSARVQEAMTAESGNFLMFITDAIQEKHNRIDQGQAPIADLFQAERVSFDEVIPPNANNKMIASQALMMTLTLGTKGLLDVRQDEHFADINLSLTEKGKTAQVEMPHQEGVEILIGEDEAGIEDVGHSEDQADTGREESDGDVEEDENEDEGSVFGD